MHCYFKANIGRIMKRAVPSHGKIAKEAKECVQECISEFIGFLTSEASDKCMSVSFFNARFV